MGVTLERYALAGVSPHEAFAYCMELVPACLCVLAPANLCPCEIWSLCVVGVRRCTRLVHMAMVLLRVSAVVAFCAALIGGGAVGAKAEITMPGNKKGRLKKGNAEHSWQNCSAHTRSNNRDDQLQRKHGKRGGANNGGGAACVGREHFLNY